MQAGGDLDTAVARVLDSLVETSGVRRAGLALSEGGGRRLRFTASDREVACEPGVAVELEWCHIDAYDDVPLTTVVRTGESILGGLELLDERFPAFARAQRDNGIAAVAALPLAVGPSPWGGVVLFYDTPQRFGPHQRDLLVASAARATAEVGAAGSVLPPEPPPFAGCACDGREAVCVEVDPLPVSVALARRFARRQLREWQVDGDVLDNAVLCLSELVTNVVVHAAARARIELRREAARVVVTVSDGGGWRRVEPAAPAVPDEPLLVHGRGLRLVAALADDWGSQVSAAGTTVWCSFAL